VVLKLPGIIQKQIGFVILLAMAEIAVAESRLPESALDGHLRWGHCFLESDVDHVLPASIWPIWCIRPQISSQLIFRDDTGGNNLAMHQARVYQGLHLHRFFSIHGEFLAQRIFRLGQNKNQVVDGSKTEDLFLQVGNIAEDRWRLSVGLLDMPFGLDFRPLIEIYDEFLKTRKFWRFPRYGATITYDTQISSQFEIGYATDKLDSETAFERGGEESQNEAVAVRAMFDIAALNGFRFVFSGYGDRVGERRIGFGMVNSARRGDESVFEFVQLRPRPSQSDDFDQLFRFGYRSIYRMGMRWVFEYESDRLDYRMGTLGADFKMPDYGVFSITTSYHKGWFKDQDDFLVVASSVRLML
jgi:hypothetical protein